MKKLLEEKKGPSENIAFISVLISILCVFSLLMSFFPLSAIFIIIFIPAITAVGTQYIEKQYLWVFAISALAATLLVTIYNYMDTLFYIYPGIISGFFYGILRKEKLPISLVIFLSSLIGMALNYLALPLIKGLYQIEMISFTIKLFNL